MKQYTFDDWLSNAFFDETGFGGQPVHNDSKLYLDLVQMGKMEYGTLYSICDVQAETYECLMRGRLYLYNCLFQDRIKSSLNPSKAIELKIKRIEQELNASEEIYYEVILPRLYNDIKVGATFITPAMYLAYQKDKKRGNAFIYPNKIPRSGQKKFWYYSSISTSSDYPTLDQKKYFEVEVKVLWLNKLKNVLNELSQAPTKNIGTQNLRTTLKSNLTEDKLRLLFNEVAVWLASNTKENDFVYMLSGNQLKNVSKIKWTSSKKRLVYLLDEICVSFSFNTANNCFDTKSKKDLDSNDRPKTGYQDIDAILKKIQ